MNQKTVERYILALPGAKKVYSEDKKLAVFEYKDEMFALVEQDKRPLRISLRCDKVLANLLKEEYDEVMAGHRLNKNKWITVVVSGQLSDQEIKDLINHSYLQVKAV
jgi:predicted DNA-binding protein (MmcQ/YjbR family)